ncbi:hypothetical protein CAPTEDRAFT_215988, partial [Capitella teleta]
MSKTMLCSRMERLSGIYIDVYIDVLDELVDEYNNTKHSSTKFTPIEASKKKNKTRVWMNLYPEHDEIKRINPKFTIGDRIRINKRKKTFEKGYTPRWTEEVFTVTSVQSTSPVTYKISDYNGEEIRGTFYEPELQKASQELYRVEKVVKKGKTKSLVKWKGYPDSFNSW